MVLATAKGDQMGIITWCRVGHGAGAAREHITKIVGKDLELVGREIAVVPQRVVVGGTACALDAEVRH